MLKSSGPGSARGRRGRVDFIFAGAVALVLSGCIPEGSVDADEPAATAVASGTAVTGSEATAATASASSSGAVTKKTASTAKSSSTTSAAKSTTSHRRLYRVIRVVDGDTVDVDLNGRERIRIIGIDAPESVDPNRPVECGGPAASDAAKRLLSGKRVSLVYDSTQAHRDRYDRLLAYVEIPSTGDFGKIMLQQGHAEEFTYAAPYRRQAAYRAAERQASSADRGIWGQCTRATATQAPAPTPTSAAPTSQAPAPAPKPAPQPKPAPVPPPPAPPAGPGPGWTNDSLTPGYTGCRQGYPGGRINGVYWWKPIAC